MNDSRNHRQNNNTSFGGYNNRTAPGQSQTFRGNNATKNYRRDPSMSAHQRAERSKARAKRRRRRQMINILILVILFSVITSAVFVIGKIFSGGTTGNDPTESSDTVLTDEEAMTKTETDAPNSEPLTGPEAYGITFISDLSSYEEYMDPENRDGYLMIANKTTQLDESYAPDDLTDLADTRADGREAQQLRYLPSKAFEAMFIEMRTCGYTDVSITSGFRSYNKQASLFLGYTNRELANNPGWTLEQAEVKVLTYSAREGTSEHQTGLCCDMHNLSEADKAFANKAAYKWLCDNAWKFGIILRYPEDKTQITGYDFEPWHYRYVGRYHAQKIHENGLCLEEYVAQIQSSHPQS